MSYIGLKAPTIENWVIHILFVVAFQISVNTFYYKISLDSNLGTLVLVVTVKLELQKATRSIISFLNICEKMSIQFTVLGFEPTTFRT